MVGVKTYCSHGLGSTEATTFPSPIGCIVETCRLRSWQELKSQRDAAQDEIREIEPWMKQRSGEWSFHVNGGLVLSGIGCSILHSRVCYFLAQSFITCFFCRASTSLQGLGKDCFLSLRG